MVLQPSIDEEDSVDHFLQQWREERPDLDTSSLGITARLSRLSSDNIRVSEAALASLGLNWEMFSLIVTLRRVGPPHALRPRDLLRESLLTSGAITNRIDRVHKLGLITRRSDPSDRRSVIVRLTASGLALANEAVELVFAAQQEFLSPLSHEENAQLCALLKKLNAAAEARAAVPTAISQHEEVSRHSPAPGQNSRTEAT